MWGVGSTCGTGLVALSDHGSVSWPILPGINPAPLGAPWPHWVLVGFLFAALPCRELLSPFCQEPGLRQQPQKPGQGRVINPKTIMEASEPIITPDIHVSDFDI